MGFKDDECLTGHSWMFDGGHKDILRKLQGCFKGAPKEILKVFQEFFKSSSRNSQGCLQNVLLVFYRRF